MKVREASPTPIDNDSLSSVIPMDVIFHTPESEYSNSRQNVFRQKIGHSAVEKTIGVKLYKLDKDISEGEDHFREAFEMAMGYVRESYEPLPNFVSVPTAVTGTSFEAGSIATSTPAQNASDIRKQSSNKKQPKTEIEIEPTSDGRLKKIRTSLGSLALHANVKASLMLGAASPQERKERAAANRAKYAKKDGDRIPRRSLNWIRRNKTEIAAWTPVAMMGAMAIERFGMVGLHYANIFEGSAFADAAPAHPAAASLPEGSETRNYDFTPLVSKVDTIIIAGGATHGMDPGLDIADMQAKGYDLGYAAQIKGVHYSGEIGPVVGTEKMDESAAGGVQDMYSQVIGDVKAGKVVQLTGYSEGTLVAIDTYNRIVAENGGVAPANLLPPLLVATPYVQGGIMDSSFTGGMVGNILNNMGIPTDRKLPPGTIVKYYDSDIYANGGNMNPSTLIANALGVGIGNHDIPNEKDLAHVFTDSDGVVHMVYTKDNSFVTALQHSGIDIMDTDSANKAFAAFFPIGKDSDGAFLKPDVRAGLTYLATTLDHQIDPSGNLHIVSDFMANLPDQYKELGQKGMEGFNNIAEMAGKIQSGEVDPFTGFMSIMGSISSVMGSLQGVTGGSQQYGNSSSYVSWSDYANDAFSNIQSGQNYGTQLNTLVQTFFGQYSANAQVSISVPRNPSSNGYNLAPQYGGQFNTYFTDCSDQYIANTPPELRTDPNGIAHWIDQDGTRHQSYAATSDGFQHDYQPSPEVTPFTTPDDDNSHVITNDRRYQAQMPQSAPAPTIDAQPQTPSHVYAEPTSEQPVITPPEAPVLRPAEVTAPVVKTPVVAETPAEAPAPIQEKAPTPPPVKYEAPVVESVPAPEAAPVPTPAPAYVPEPAPVAESAPTPPPAPVFEAPAPAPVPEPAPAPAFKMPDFGDIFKPSTHEQAPSMNFGPAFGGGSSSSSSSHSGFSFGSGSSSSSSSSSSSDSSAISGSVPVN